jgi:hypothetical protein
LNEQQGQDRGEQREPCDHRELLHSVWREGRWKHQKCKER